LTPISYWPTVDRQGNLNVPMLRQSPPGTRQEFVEIVMFLAGFKITISHIQEIKFIISHNREQNKS
jgi:hypothetical protein